jgi:hypothetical protein
MADAARSVLVLDDGGVPSLVGALLVDEPSAVHVRFVGRSPRARAISKRRSERLAFAGWYDAGPSKSASELLLAALREARRIAAPQVVWPEFASEDLDRMSLAISRVRLIEDLAALDCPPDAAPPHIETPLLDLDARRICDLAVDLDAPLDAESVWWCDAAGSRVCGQCEACRLWQTAIAGPRAWEGADAAPVA